jgi:putative endonuclease
VKGYRIVARNLRLPQGEIDVVARRGRALVFIEVKYRADIGLAQDAVTARQWQRIAPRGGAICRRAIGFAGFALAV